MPYSCRTQPSPCRFPSAASRRRLLGAIALALSPLAGCQKPEEQIRPGTSRGGMVPMRSVIGTSVEGRPIECEVFGSGRDTILILATIHGNEPAGTPLLHELSNYLSEHPELVEGRRVILVPEANPDGYAKNLRHNVRGVDLNRNFPAGNYRTSNRNGDNPLSEPESQAIYRLIREYSPHRIISIHQPTTLPACIDFDGPGQALAREMARHTDLPLKKLGSRPGSLGSYAGLTLGTPIITLEIPRTPDDRDGPTLWRRYGEMMLAAIAYRSK